MEPTHRPADVDRVPAGLLEKLRADASRQGVRRAELARVRRRMRTVSPDQPEVVDGIIEGLIEVSN
ncbi:MAG TPA: hypothetical protein VF230_07560 [Acidimicrobiales bacterium]